MIAFAPGWPLWDLARHAAWLTGPVIVITAACLAVTPLLLAAAWLRPPGLRCVLAVALGLVLLVLAAKRITAVSFVPRPFVSYHFRPLYPHAADTSFPSVTTGCFAVVAGAALAAWRRLGWLFAVITGVVAFGCAYVGVHYVTDVLAGAVLGLACGLAAWLILGCPPLAWALRHADRALSRLHLRRRPDRQPAGPLIDHALGQRPRHGRDADVRRARDHLPELGLSGSLAFAPARAARRRGPEPPGAGGGVRKSGL